MLVRERPEPAAELLHTTPLSRRVHARGARPRCLQPPFADPSGLRSKLRGVFLDGAGGFALRPRGKPRRFVSPAFRTFRTGAGEEGGGRAGCVAGGPWGSADPRPGLLAEATRACAPVGPPHLSPPPRSLLSASPRVAGGPWKASREGGKKV